jgi:hypothetical protein
MHCIKAVTSLASRLLFFSRFVESHRTLSGFRVDYRAALDDLFVQVLGMISAEGLITMQRVTLDGTKIKANASGNTFRRKEKLEAHLALAWSNVQRIAISHCPRVSFTWAFRVSVALFRVTLPASVCPDSLRS